VGAAIEYYLKGCKEEGELYLKGNGAPFDRHCPSIHLIPRPSGGIDRQLDQLKDIAIEVAVGLADTVGKQVLAAAPAVEHRGTARLPPRPQHRITVPHYCCNC
jgi:hypothetical protein